MHDVLETYGRKPGREHSASDSDLVVEKFTDFRRVFEIQSLVMMAFTSQKAAEWTLSALKQQELLTDPEHLKQAFLRWRRIKPSGPIEEYLELKFQRPFARGQIANRELALYILPSPTTRGLKLCQKQKIYEQVLLNAGCKQIN